MDRRAIDTARRLATGGVKRTFRLAAIGWRADGVIVTARNGSSIEPNVGSHAEARLAKKLTPGSVVLVVRIKRDGTLGSAKPCRACRSILRSVGVESVYYSGLDGEIHLLELPSR